MQRHSDRKAFLKDRGENKLQWSGRVGDRDRDRDRAQLNVNHPGRSSASSPPPASAPSPVAQSSPEGNKIENDLLSSSSMTGQAPIAEKKGRVVPLGDHHEGSFGVYMAHKMEKLRQQAHGSVSRVEGSEGSLFKGVVAHINGYTLIPVDTIRELLISRGGVIEAYNTARCTHMICESLPYAKIRELRKLKHPPTVVRSAWVTDSVDSGRKLPLAGYMVEGVFVQKRTLAEAFGAAPALPSAAENARGSNPRLAGGTSAQSRSSTSNRQDPGSVSREASPPGYADAGGGAGSASDNETRDAREIAALTHEKATDACDGGAATVPERHADLGDPDGDPSAPAGRASSPARLSTSANTARVDEPRTVERASPRKEPAREGDREGAPPRLFPDLDNIHPMELMALMPESAGGGRSTKDDPTFMKTFFQNSRLHFIGVARARAVKLVNAGLAARAQPGGPKPVFGGPLGRGNTRLVLHVDLDCFFVSVLLRNKPELKDRPVAVAHNASNAKGAGSSEVSCCNYPARAMGVTNGMFMMMAKERCPELIVLRYDFEAYSDVSDKLYNIFLKYAPVVMAVSCDEAYLELAEGTDPMVAAGEIRASIMKETGCPASAGASTNMLLARIATKEAKPNGQCYLPPETALRHMGSLPVQDLPGVGWKLRRRLNEAGLKVCSDLWPLSASHLKKGLGLGEKTGQALWEACRGIDKRPVQAPPDRKSIGAEVNYGVRFDTQAQADEFLGKLAMELSRRMSTEGVVGRALTLKIMKQREGVSEPKKFLGHGICDVRSKLLNLARATDDGDTLKFHAVQLLKEARIPPNKIRGIGVQMTRLEPASDARGTGGAGAEGGRVTGMLHDWLVKPGDEKSTSSADPSGVSGDVLSAVHDTKGVKPLTQSPAVLRRRAVDKDKAQHKLAASILDGAGAPPAGKKRMRENDHSVAGDRTSPAPVRRRNVDSGSSGYGNKNNPRPNAVQLEAEGQAVSKANKTPGRTALLNRMASATETDGKDALSPSKLSLGVVEQPQGQDSPPAHRLRTSSSPPRAVERLQPRHSPGLNDPVTPSARLSETPRSVAGSPTMSQMTLSQVDSTVLDALPADLRREVLSQLATRQQERIGQPRSGPSPEPDDRSARQLPDQRIGGPCAAPGACAAPAAPGAHSREPPASVTLAASTSSIVRDGFDLSVRGGSSKPQQVNLDNLWTLRKLQDDLGNGEGVASTIDRDSLRAMPLGLGLQYASLTDHQRAQVAGEHARQPLNGPGSDERRRVSTPAPDDGRSMVSGPVHLQQSGGPHQPGPRPMAFAAKPPPDTTRQPQTPGSAAGLQSTSPSRSWEQHRISLSQVDRDVLECLPSEVREEVLRAIASTSTPRQAPDEREATASVDTPVSPTGGQAADTAGALPEKDAQTDLIDLRSPATPTTPSRSDVPSPPEAERSRQHTGFVVERADTLRGALRSWIGGAVRSPSQWHLELLYRYLEELVEGDRLAEVATLLRCIGRLARKADGSVGGSGNSPAASGRGGGWIRGYKAMLDAVQNLVRQRTGGASLSLLC